MRVRAPDSRRAAIEVIAHSQLFARGVRVDFGKSHVIHALVFLEDAVCTQERIVRAVFHVAAADQVHDEQAHALRAVINAPTPTGALRRKIGRTENIRTAVQIRHDLLLAEHMVAERDHVRAGGKNIIRLTRENAVAGRIFAVYDDEIRAGVALDAAEQAVKRVDTRLTDHIADD